MTSFPRLDSLAETSANYKRASKLNKKILLAQIYQLQNEVDQLNGKASILEAQASSKSLKDWTDVINRSRQLAHARGKRDIRETVRDLRTVFSELSFRISNA